MKSHQPRYAIRKYAVGVASVLVGFLLAVKSCKEIRQALQKALQRLYRHSQVKETYLFLLRRKLSAGSRKTNCSCSNR
ncbi:MAG: YSIRK-type signal peptide-containing protein [Streptococcus sp.]